MPAGECWSCFTALRFRQCVNRRVDLAQLATTRAVEAVFVCREELVTPTDVREELLNEAPQREGDFIRVPKIVAS